MYNNMGGIISAHGNTSLGLTTSQVLNATGESVTYMGYCFLEGGSGTKTISSAGGKIYWVSTTITFADAGTNLRIGIQDVAATGLETGTFDVYADLVGGTDTITAGIVSTAMETGAKTITHGDLIAISVEMTARGGADTVSVLGNTYAHGSSFPYSTTDSGGGVTRSATIHPSFFIEFDDGTTGWIWMSSGISGSVVGTSFQGFSSSSTPDEYAAVFKVPFKCEISGIALSVGGMASTDTFELVLYSDPEGTPVAERTVTCDPNYTGSTSVTASGPYWGKLSTPFTLLPETLYAIALRPTSTNSLNMLYIDFASGNEKLKKPFFFGTNLKMSARTNQAGAFSVVQNYYMPFMWLNITELETGAAETSYGFAC